METEETCRYVPSDTEMPDTSTLPEQIPVGATYGRTWAMPPYTSSMVTLFAGGPTSPSREPQPTCFRVHRDILTSSSPFFNTALSDRTGWSESETNTIRLPEDRADDVAFFLQWLYHKHSTARPPSSSQDTPHAACADYFRAPHPLNHAAIEPAVGWYLAWKFHARQLNGEPRPNPPTLGPLIRLYIFADKYDIGLDLRADILQRLRLITRNACAVPNQQDVGMIWEVFGDNPRDELRRAVVAMYARLRCDALCRLLGFEVVRDHESDSGGGELRFVAGRGCAELWHPGFLCEVLLARAAEEKRVWRRRVREEVLKGEGLAGVSER